MGTVWLKNYGTLYIDGQLTTSDCWIMSALGSILILVSSRVNYTSSVHTRSIIEVLSSPGDYTDKCSCFT